MIYLLICLFMYIAGIIISVTATVCNEEDVAKVGLIISLIGLTLFASSGITYLICRGMLC